MGTSGMRFLFRMIVASAAALGVVMSAASAQNIDCAKIGTAYDDLFADGIRRVNEVKAEFGRANTTPERREQVSRQFCAVAGELLGLYKFVAALANECSRRGSNNVELRGIIDKQRSLTEQALKGACQ